MILANNLGFTYTLSVNEAKTKANLDKFINKTLGGKDGLKVPIQLDIKSSFDTSKIQEIQNKINSTYKGKLKLGVKLNIDTNSITGTALQNAQSKLNEQANKLFMKVDLKLDNATVSKFATSLSIFKELNTELTGIQGKLGSFGKKLTVNVGAINVQGAYQEIETAMIDIESITKNVNLSLQGQLDIQRQNLELLKDSLATKADELKLAEAELKTKKETKKVAETTKDQTAEINARIESLTTELEAHRAIVTAYNQQQKEIAKAGESQEELAKKAEASAKKLAELQSKQTSVKTVLETSKAEQQRHQNSIEATKAEIKALQEKIATLKEIEEASDATITATPQTKQSTKKKADSSTTVKELDKVTETAKKSVQETATATETAVKSGAKVADEAVKNEAKIARTKQQTAKIQKKANEEYKQHAKKANEITEAINLENIQIMTTTKEMSAYEKEVYKGMVEQRGVLGQITLSKEEIADDSEEAIARQKEYLRLLEQELALSLEVVGNNKDYQGSKANVTKAKTGTLAKYGVSSKEDFEKLSNADKQSVLDSEATMTAENVKYKYTRELLSEINKLREKGLDSTEATNQLLDAQNKKLKERASTIEQIQETKKTNKAKALLYPDAKSYVTEEMFGFTPEQLEDLMEEYEAKLQYRTKKGETKAVTPATISAMDKQIAKLRQTMESSNDETFIDKTAKSIEKLIAQQKRFKELQNTYSQLSAILSKNDMGDDDYIDYVSGGVETPTKETVRTLSDAVVAMKDYVTQADKFIKAQGLIEGETQEVRKQIGFLRADLEKTDLSTDEDVWNDLANRMKRVQEQLGFTNEELEQYTKLQSEIKVATPTETPKAVIKTETKAEVDNTNKSLEKTVKLTKYVEDNTGTLQERLERSGKAVQDYLIPTLEYLATVTDRLAESSKLDDFAEKNIYKNVTADTDPMSYQIPQDVLDAEAQSLALKRSIVEEFTKARKELRGLMSDAEKAQYNIAKLGETELTIVEQQADALLRLQDDLNAQLSKANIKDVAKMVKSDDLRSLQYDRKQIINQGKKSVDGVRYNTTDEYKQRLAMNKQLINEAQAQIEKTVSAVAKKFQSTVSIASTLSAKEKEQATAETKKTSDTDKSAKLAKEELAILQKELAEKEELLQLEARTLAEKEKQAQNAEEELYSVKGQLTLEQAKLKAVEKTTAEKEKLATISKEEYTNSKDSVAVLQAELRELKQLAKQKQASLVAEEDPSDNAQEQAQRVEQITKEYSELQKQIESTEKSIASLMEQIKEQPAVVIPAPILTTEEPESAPEPVAILGKPADEKEDSKSKYKRTFEEELQYQQRSLELTIKQIEYAGRYTEEGKETLENLKEQVSLLGAGTTSIKELKDRVKDINLEIRESKFDLGVSDDAVKEMQVLSESAQLMKQKYQNKLEDYNIGTLIAHTSEEELNSIRQMVVALDENVSSSKQLEQATQAINQAWHDMENSAKVAKKYDNDWKEAIKYNEQLDKMSAKEKLVAKAVQEKINATNIDLQQKYEQMSLTTNINNLTEEQARRWQELGTRLEVNGTTIKEVNTSYKALNQEMNQFNIDGLTNKIQRQETMLSRLGQTLKSMPMQYMSLQGAINFVERGFRDAYQYAFELDDAYTNVSMTMEDMTKDKFSEWIVQAKKVADVNGVMTDSVIDMMKVYANADSTIADVNEQLNGTIAFQNVTGWDAETTTKSVQTMIKQFRLVEDRAMSASQAIEKSGDIVTAVGYNLAKEEADAVREIVSAIETAGAVIYQAGGSLEWYSAIAGGLAETMNASGSEVGNAMKMVTARILQQKQVLEDMDESTENLAMESAKAEQALKDIGVTIRGEAGELRSIEDIIADVASKWGGLTDASKQYVAEMMAGNNRRSYLQNILDNYERIAELQEKATNSEGTLMEASDKKAQSLEGTLNRVKNTLGELYQSLMDNGTITDTLLAVDGLLKSLVAIMDFMEGKWLIALGVATGALVTFKATMMGASVTEYLTFLGKLALEHVGLTGAINGTAFATKALKVAMGGLAVGAVVTVFSAMSAKAKEAEENFANIEKTVKDLKTGLDDLNTTDDLIQQYKEINQQLESSVLTDQQHNELNEKLVGIKQDLIDKSSALQAILDDNTKSYEDQVKAMENISAFEKEGMIREALEKTDISDEDKIELTTRIDNGADWLDQLNDRLAESYAEEKKLRDQFNNADTQQERIQAHEKLQNISKKIADDEATQYNMQKALVSNLEKALAINEAITIAEEEGIPIYEQKVAYGERAKEVYDSLFQVMQDINEEEDKVGEDGDIEEPKVLTDEEKAKAIQEQNKAMVEQLSLISEARELLDSIGENGYGTDAMNSLMNLFPEFTGDILSAGEAQDFLTEKIAEMSETADQAYAKMIASDYNLWSTRIANSTEWAEHMSDIHETTATIAQQAMGTEYEAFQEFMNQKGLLYEFDYSNATNALEAEQMVTGQALNQMLDYYEQFLMSKGLGREDDFLGVVDFLDAQKGVEYQTIDELIQAWQVYYQGKLQTMQTELATLEGMDDMYARESGQREESDAVKNKRKELEALKNGAESASKAWDGLANSFSNTMGAFKSDGFDVGKLTDPKLNDKSSSKETEKVVEDLEDIRDRYYDINNALKDVSNSLTLVETKMKNTTGADLVNLYNKEIALLRQKSQLLGEHKNLMLEQADELRNQLSNEGFQFDGEGNITNYMAQFANLRNWANSLAGDEKEDAKKRVEDLMDTVNEYTTLIKTSLPDVTNEWESMASAIKEIEKEMAQNTTDTQKEVGEALEHYFQKRYDITKKALEKEQKLLSSQWEEDDYQDNLASEQRKLDEIRQQMQDLSRDQSDYGKAKLAELRKQYEEQQKVIDDMVKDWERDQTSNRFEEESEKLDEELENALSPENLVNMINQAITSGFVTIGDEVVKLDDIMSDWLNETGDGLYAIGDILREELVGNLETAQAIMAEMGITNVRGSEALTRGIAETQSYSVADSARMLSNDSKVRSALQELSLTSAGSVTVSFDAPLVQIQGNVSEDLLPTIKRMVKQSQDETITKISKLIVKK